MSRRREIITALRALITITAVCALSIYAWDGLTSVPSLDDRGGVGQVCYPNDTCRGGLTCYEIRERHQCEREIKPVFADGLPSCYAFDVGQGEQQRCFETNNECLVSFARISGDRDTRIILGCSQ